MARRKSVRARIYKVVHRHRLGARRFLRVSELAFVNGVPKAVLEWIDIGGVSTPLYLCDLDPAKLKASRANAHTFYYAGETMDPRYEPVRPATGHA